MAPVLPTRRPIVAAVRWRRLAEVLAVGVAGVAAGVVTHASDHLIALDLAIGLLIAVRRGWLLGIVFFFYAGLLQLAGPGDQANAVLIVTAIMVEFALVALLARVVLERSASWRLLFRIPAFVGVVAAAAVLHLVVIGVAGIDTPTYPELVVFGSALGATLGLAVLCWWSGSSSEARNQSGAVGPLIVVALLLATAQGTATSWRWSDEDSLESAARSASSGFFTAYTDIVNTMSTKASTASTGDMGSVSTFESDLRTIVYGLAAVTSAALVDLAPDGTATLVASLNESGTLDPRFAAAVPGMADELGREMPIPLPIDVGIVTMAGPDGVLSPHLITAMELLGPTVDTEPGHRRFLVLSMSSAQMLSSPTFAGSFPGTELMMSIFEDGDRIATWSSSEELEQDATTKMGISEATVGSNLVSITAIPGENFGRTLAERLRTYGIEALIALALLIVVVRLVSVRQKADAESRERQAVMEAALDAAPGIALVFDHDMRIDMANVEALRLMGIAERGSPVIEVVRRVSPDGISDNEMLKLQTGLVHALRGSPSSLDLVVPAFDGGLRIYQVAIRPVRASGRVAGGFLQAVDVTDQREQAIRNAQAERLESLGAIAGNVAHDFNNLLFVIQGNLQLLAMSPEVEDDDELSGYVRTSNEAVDRATSIVKSLLAVARSQSVEEEKVDLGDHLSSMVPLLTQALGSPHRLEVTFEMPATVKADPGRLSSSLLNLVVNARDAMKQAGLVHITVGMPLEDEGATDGSMVAIRVEDDGSGMDAETAARAFELFFTTKKQGNGTGLGLASVHAFSRQSGGTAYLSSAPGRGTRVTMVLPFVSVDRPETQPSTDGASLQGVRVLVIDDETALSHLVGSWLRSLGAKVWTANSPAEALDVLTQASPQLLVTDVELGADMDGVQLADSAQLVFPNLATVFMTGFSKRIEELTQRNAYSLAKPFTLDELAETSRRALSSRNGLDLTTRGT